MYGIGTPVWADGRAGTVIGYTIRVNRFSNTATAGFYEVEHAMREKRRYRPDQVSDTPPLPPPRTCDVCWGSHGCCLPAGHEVLTGPRHLCADSTEPCVEIIWRDGVGWWVHFWTTTDDPDGWERDAEGMLIGSPPFHAAQPGIVEVTPPGPRRLELLP